MCGRYALTLPPDAMRAVFGYAEQPNFPPRFNIAPTQPVPIIRQDADGQRHFVLVRWGLVPDWAKEVGTKPLFNARGETVSEKPSFRSAFKRRRCLVPADGFYEWKAQATGFRQPHLIRRRDRGVMAFAGIWEHWHSAEGSELESCSIITTTANTTLMTLHHRMPVILEAGSWDTWLDTTETRTADALSLITPAADNLLDVVPVSRRANAVANDDAGIQEPADTDDFEDKTSPAQANPQMSLF
ncbi:SOS response-associated peptidase [Pyruvatibacter sp.]|uniref:SOS response-associated peptidase n=1 Tax=Pyruvatibacter sp. TaxID=1981328 RepID=UPI0032EE8860